MPFTESELNRIDRAASVFMAKHRPPPEIRNELDLDWRIAGQSIEVFEVRPRFRGAPGEILQEPVAKATFVRTRGIWRVFWMMSDMKWHGYQPMPEVMFVEEFFRLVAEDEYACFFG